MILKPLAQIFFFGLNQISPPTQNHTVKLKNVSWLKLYYTVNFGASSHKKYK